MKQGDIIKAYKATAKLAEQKLPLTTAYKIFKLREQMKPAWDFQAQEENKLMDEYRPEPGENGTVKFRTVEEKCGFEDRLKEIADMESDVEITPVTLPLTDDIAITVGDLADMQMVITFQE